MKITLMKITFCAILIAIFIGLIAPVGAQPPHSCGTIGSMSVVYDRVDSNGYAPRLKEGSQDQFNCIAARDPNFNSQRFPSAWQATNYWFTLLSAETGLSLLPLPAP